MKHRIGKVKNKVVVEGGGTNTLKNNEVLVEGNAIKIKENNQIKDLGNQGSSSNFRYFKNLKAVEGKDYYSMSRLYSFDILCKFQGKIKHLHAELDYLPIYFRVDSSDLYFIELVSPLFPSSNIKNLDDIINRLNTSDGNKDIWNLVEVSEEEALNPDNYEIDLTI